MIAFTQNKLTHDFLQLIKPGATPEGAQPFFSEQIYRWLCQRPDSFRVFAGTWNSITGVDREKPVLYIGTMDKDSVDGPWFYGRALHHLGQKERWEPLDSFAYGPAHDTVGWFEVTERWWKHYLETGLCAIHGDAAHDWNLDDRCRRCNKSRSSTSLSPRIPSHQGVTVK